MKPQLTELMSLWLAVLGEPIPADNQFLTWLALHGLATVKIGIAKTSAKNLSLGGTMSENHKIRFASKVMLTKTDDPQKAAGQQGRMNELKTLRVASGGHNDER